jgi:hypothetical protein
MKFIYFTYNFTFNGRDGGEICANTLYDYLVESAVRDNVLIYDLRIKEGDNDIENYSYYLTRNNQINKIIATFKSFFNSNDKTVNLFSKKTIYYDLIKIISKFPSNEKVKIIYSSYFNSQLVDIVKKVENELNFQNKFEHIYIAGNVESKLALDKLGFNLKSDIINLMSYYKYLKMERSLNRFTKVICFSNDDQNKLVNMNSEEINISVIYPLFKKTLVQNQPDWKSRILLITTNLEHLPNYISLDWFVKSVYPLIDPTINIVITGKGDFTKFKSITDVKGNVNYLGLVEKSVLKSLFVNSCLVLNPTISGSGIQIKLLEPISYGCNVFTTRYSNQFPDIIPEFSSAEEMAKNINTFFANQGIRNSEFDYEKIFIKNFEKFKNFIIK